MGTNKKINYRKWALPAVFMVLLALTIVFHQWAFSQDKEALGTDVHVKVTEIRANGGGLNPGGLNVTVSYQGEKYRLRGVPSSAHFVMENSRKYRSTICARLYNGKLYYASSSISLLSDKLYYTSLAATFFVFVLMFGKSAGIIDGGKKFF